MANRIVWFDLPVADLVRASAFYHAVLSARVEEAYPGICVIASESGEVSGCLYEDADRAGSGGGPLLYFNVDGRLHDAVALVAECGGTIEEAPRSIDEHGFRAVVGDTEGNRVALHSQS